MRLERYDFRLAVCMPLALRQTGMMSILSLTCMLFIEERCTYFTELAISDQFCLIVAPPDLHSDLMIGDVELILPYKCLNCTILRGKLAMV